MINLEDGSVLTGKDCPRKRHMEAWLQQHPGYMIDNSICLLDPYLADMRASLASRSSRDKESGSSKQSTEKSVPASMEGTAGAHKLSSSHFPGSASSLSASTSPPVSMRTREHHQLMELGEREEEPNPQFVLNTPEIKPVSGFFNKLCMVVEFYTLWNELISGRRVKGRDIFLQY